MSSIGDSDLFEIGLFMSFILVRTRDTPVAATGFAHLSLWWEHFGLGLAVLWLFTSVAGADAGVPTPEALGRDMEATAWRVLNVRVDFESWTEVRDGDAAEWRRSDVDSVSGVAWYNGMPRSKYRISVSKHATKWVNGAAPSIVRRYDLGFDGKEGRLVKHARSAGGNATAQMTAEILPGPPPDAVAADLGYATGVEFTLFLGHPDKKNRPAHEIILDGVRNGYQLAISSEKFDGVPTISYKTGGPQTAETQWWLDPARGFALIGYKIIDNANGRPSRWTQSDVVTKLVEAAPGIWFPTEAYRERTRYKPGNEISRAYFRAKQVVVNDPDFNEAVFTVPIPAGYTVHDRVLGTTYEAGPDAATLGKHIDAIVTEALAYVGSSPFVSVN